MNSFEGKYVSIEDISRNMLKKKSILSGDGFIHLSFQVAKMLTYISLDARVFFRGRTESNRPISCESIEFINTLLNKSSNKEEKYNFLVKALDKHHERTRECQRGEGVNRYLYVLEQVYNDYKDELRINTKPRIFDCKAFYIIFKIGYLLHHLDMKNIKYLYFPPVMKKGLGIYYMLGDDSCFIVITAFNEDSKHLNSFISNLKIAISMMLKCL